MTNQRLHLIWFFHQPFFVPDDEILWRINSTYLPLIEALTAREIKFSLGLTASLLERFAALHPEIVGVLQNGAASGKFTLIGTTAYHPVLPWLSGRSARAQILVDREVKARFDLPRANVFWPTELAWSTRVGSLAAEYGYDTVVVDSSARDNANLLPKWDDSPHGLRPNLSIDSPLGLSPKVSTYVGTAKHPFLLSLWVRERALSNALLKSMAADEEESESLFTDFAQKLESFHLRSFDPMAPLILADDPERYLPNGLARLLRLLDAAQKASIQFVSTQELATLPTDVHLNYVPASTMEGDDSMWTAAVDDKWFRTYLDQLTARVEARFDLLRPRNDIERAVRHNLLRTQDSSFYFWHFVGRARREFYSNLAEIEMWLDQQDSNPDSNGVSNLS